MAKTSLVVKQKRPQKYKVRAYSRCNRCGRPRAVFKKFGLCRICLRELAHQGVIPGMTKSRKSIANFKVRANFPVGCMVTLRGARMYEFLDRLVSIALPRIRDFRGLDPGSFDGRGNYSLGIREQIIFPEINYDDIQEVRGLDVTITTTAENDEHARALLQALGLPFSGEGERRDQ